MLVVHSNLFWDFPHKFLYLLLYSALNYTLVCVFASYPTYSLNTNWILLFLVGYKASTYCWHELSSHGSMKSDPLIKRIPWLIGFMKWQIRSLRMKDLMNKLGVRCGWEWLYKHPWSMYKHKKYEIWNDPPSSWPSLNYF